MISGPFAGNVDHFTTSVTGLIENQNYSIRFLAKEVGPDGGIVDTSITGLGAEIKLSVDGQEVFKLSNPSVQEYTPYTAKFIAGGSTASIDFQSYNNDQYNYLSNLVITGKSSISISQTKLKNASDAISLIDEGVFDFNFTSNVNNGLGSNISDTNFYSIANSIWGDGDMIKYSSSLVVGGSAADAVSGTASINQTTGVASFNVADDTLIEQINAVENALYGTGSQVGQFAEWSNGGNTYVLITDGTHTSSAIDDGDILVKLVGVDTSHVMLDQGHLIYA